MKKNTEINVKNFNIGRLEFIKDKETTFITTCVLCNNSFSLLPVNMMMLIDNIDFIFLNETGPARRRLTRVIKSSLCPLALLIFDNANLAIIDHLKSL
jgi:hypothetical protein